MGTPAFMPPEQARGEAADERSDIYAIGAILYSVLTGAPPISGERALEDASAGAITPLVEREPSTPPELASIVERAMAFAPHERYASERSGAGARALQHGPVVSSHTYSTATLAARISKIAPCSRSSRSPPCCRGARGGVGPRDHREERARGSECARVRTDELVKQRATSDDEHAESIVQSDPSLAIGLLRSDAMRWARRGAAARRYRRGERRRLELVGPRETSSSSSSARTRRCSPAATMGTVGLEHFRAPRRRSRPSHRTDRGDRDLSNGSYSSRGGYRQQIAVDLVTGQRRS